MTSSPFVAPTPLFELDQLSFLAGARVLLHPLSLSLQPGRMIGLIGHNGSGKSTLLKLLARQQAPAAGAIRFQGRPLAGWRDRDFARQLGFLPQYLPPATGMLVKELVALGRYPWHGALGRFGRLDRDKVAEAIELADIGAFGDRLVDSLSGGERQRAWLAMLMAQDASCPLLDEPISALDIAHQVDMLGLIRRLCTERGCSVIVVLHDVNMAARFCDEILALHSGRLILRGAPADLMRREQLQRVYNIPMGVFHHPETGTPLGYVI